MIKVLCLLCLFTLKTSVFAQNIVHINSTDEIVAIGKNLEFLEDKTGNLSIKDILKAQTQKQFQRNSKDLFLRRPTASAYWFKITVSNQTKEDIWLALGNTTAQYLDFYAPDSLGKYKVHKTGRMRPHEVKFYRIITDFWLPLNQGMEVQPKTYYFRIKQSALFRYKPQAGSFKLLSEEKIVVDTLNAIFLGWMLIMILYNLFLSFFTKDSIYLYYVGYLITVLLTATYISSYPVIDFLLNYQYTYFLSNYYPVWNYPAFLFTILFCIQYLDLKDNLKGGRKLLIICAVLYLFLIFLPNIFGYFPKPLTIFFLQILSLSTYFICLTIALYLFWAKKMKKAKYYVLGWSFYIVGLFVFITRTSSFMPDSVYVQKAFLLGIAMETWMFSLALGKRFSILKEEKEKAQAENIKLIKSQNELLEKAIKKRTAEIEEQKEELRVSNQSLLSQEEELRQNFEELQATQDFLEEKQQEVLQKNRHIEKLYKNLTESIEYAQTIQQVILPSAKQFTQIFPDSFVFFKPRDVVSGDFYYLKKFQDKILLAAVDCTGHGVPGAFMSLISNDILQDIIVNKQILETNKILELLHLNIRQLLKQTETNNRDGMDISLVVIDKKQKMMEFSGAKNPLIYIKNKEFHLIKGDKFSIGGEQKESKRVFKKHQISLEGAFIFYLFSDGYQDQFGGVADKKFMRKPFYNLLLEHHTKDMNTQKDIYAKVLQEWQGHLEQIDDVLLIGVKMDIRKI